jgi:two-component system response regulator DevR
MMNVISEQVSTPTLSVAIVDDHVVLTEALGLVIRNEPDLEVAGVADTCAAARELLKRTCPNVLLLDVSLPDGDGLSLVPEFKHLCPDMHILVLTSLSDEKTLLRALEVAVNGFVGKNRHVDEVLAAIRQAGEGEIIIPPSLLVGLLSRVPRVASIYSEEVTREPLTPREQEILRHLAAGHSGAAIAAQLNISEVTVRTHIRNLMTKLGVHSRLEAVTFALRQGLVELPG